MATDKKKQSDGKTVLVTGAYGGMGKATVRLLARRGFRVYALDKRVEAAEDNVTPIETDVTDEESVASAFETVKKTCTHLDAILHFAGIYLLDSLVEMSDESFRRIFDVNLRGAFLVNKQFFSLLGRGSRILITTSELAPLDPLPFTGLYAVSKAALDKYAYSLRMELQLLGVSVSVLRAGAVKTDMLGVSTDHLERFCEDTTLYSCNAARFKRIVDGVEAKHIPPEKIAAKCHRILQKRHAKFAYAINRNPLLLLLDLLPKRMQLWAIRMVLRSK